MEAKKTTSWSDIKWHYMNGRTEKAQILLVNLCTRQACRIVDEALEAYQQSLKAGEESSDLIILQMIIRGVRL